MPGSRATVLRRVVRSVAKADRASLTDRELLRRFARDNDQEAFEALVSRHTAMVFGVCRRALPTVPDAEDACQATFLVLAKKANSGRWQESVANWLYTTARKLARNARLTAERRRKRETAAAVPEAVAPVDRMTGRELLAALDAALEGLPPHYREPLVLCYLEGLTRDEAATRLGLPPATLKVRLERGRKRLHDALTKAGCALGVGLLALAATSPAGASPPRLLESILAAAGGSPSASAAALAQGVAVNLWVKKTVFAAVGLIGVTLVGAVTTGVGLQARQAPASVARADEPSKEKKGQHAANEKAKPTPGERIITGKVLGPDGKPLAGAAVYLFGRKKGRTPAEPVRVATTDADGRFTFDTARTPPGLTAPTLVAVADRFAPDWAPVAEPGGEVALRLAEEVPIRGRLVDLQGKPIAGAVAKLLAVGTFAGGNLQPAFNAMRLNPEWLHFEKRIAALAPAFTTQMRTDADGRFELKGVGRDRVAVLRFEAPGVEAAKVYVVTQPGFDPKSVLPQPKDKETVARGFVPDLRLAVYGPTFTHSAKPSHDITGTVTDAATGRPVPNVTVVGTAAPDYASGEPYWGNPVETTTDRDGRFRLSGLPKAGRRFLHLQPGDNPYLDRVVEVSDVKGLAPATADVTLDRCAVVEGRITDRATGKPVKGNVKYLPLRGNAGLEDESDERTRLYRGGVFTAHPTGTRADTDDAGRFRLRVPHGPGVILARADTERDPAAYYTAVRVAAADRKYLRVRGPGLGARSTSRPAMAKTRDRSEDDETFATIVLTWPLRWENGYALLNPGVKGDTVKVDIRFDPGQSVSGKVVGPDGEPVAGAKAVGTRATDELKPTTLPGTTFTVHALTPDRPREMFFVHEGKKLVGTVTVRVGDKEPVVRLRPWAAVTGRVLNPDGTPAANAEVSFQLLDGFANEFVRQKLYADRGRKAARTDKDGQFRVEGMFPGLEVTVTASTPGLRFGTGSKSVVPKPGETVDVGDLKLPASRE